jgi:small subunit ribosomal protein S16
LAVKLRLTRFGRLNYPTYRVCATDSRSKRDGRIVETLGYYLPKSPRAADQLSLNAERISYWLSVGAQPSDTVRSLIRRSGIPLPVRKPRKRNKPKSKAAGAASAPPRRVGKGRLAKARWRAKHGAKAEG